MKFLLSIICLTFFAMTSCHSDVKSSSTKFYSADAREAVLTYKTYFLMPTETLSAQARSDHRQLSHGDKIKIGKALKLHVLHLYGVFSYHQKPVNFSVYNGSIMERGKHKINSISKQGSKHLRVEYTYQDRSIFYDELFTGKNTKIKFLMPNSPIEIYKNSFMPNPPKNKEGEPINTCTSLHDNSKAAFWYYWSPDRKGCPKSIRKRLHYVTANLSLLPQTKLTYPEYKKLYFQKRGEDGRGKFRIDLIVGPDEEMNNPKDLGRITFDHTFNYLGRMKSSAQKRTFKVMKNSKNYKVLRYTTNLFDADVHIHYKSPDEPDFASFAAKAVRASDLFIFAGHSYEGKYFSLQTMFNNRSINLPKSKYQIMFFNACTTYAYYNFNYFKAKQSSADPRGTKNLDLMTNGIGSPFLLDSRKKRRTIVTADIITIASVLGIRLDGRPLKKYRSWQEILGRITANSGFDFTGLTSVMGDEDNPKVAPNFAVGKPTR